jgi:endonuclease/exonuclease/phosphatase family metal-dependent hydrolase
MSNYTSHNFSVNKGNYPTFESVEITVSGKTITIVNTHNDYVLDPYQEQEVTDLLAFLANLKSFVLCGDFNINLSTQDTTDDQYTNSVKRFLDAGYNVGNCVVDWIPTYFGTSSPTGGKFTDQFVTSSDIIIKKLYADTTKLTDGIDDKIDHLPLIAILTIGADAT